MAVDPQISELCRRVRISDYLRSKGVNVIRRGSRECCVCPLGTHRDSDPSCFLRTLADGTELFKCFGCGKGGNIITMMAALEKQTNGQIVKKLSKECGVILTGGGGGGGGFVKAEPFSEEVDTIFCDEQDVIADLAEYAVEFMRENPTVDAVNKISRMYDMIDQMVRLGDWDEIERYYEELKKTIFQYTPKKEEKPLEKSTQ